MVVGLLLKQIVDQIKPELEALDPDLAAIKAGQGKWSKKEILGHLIDSASCNHRRFVLACSKDNLVFDGYDQNVWVDIQQYQDSRWSDLIALWCAFNRHLSRVMIAIPDSVCNKVHVKHNFDKIAMRAVPLYTPTSLEYLMRDYVWHLEHHITQIIPQYTRRLHW